MLIFAVFYGFLGWLVTVWPARCHHILYIFYIVTLFNNCVILFTLCFTLWHAQAVSRYFPMTVNWPIKTQSTKNTWYPIVVLYPTTINRPNERVCNMRNMCVSWSFFKWWFTGSIYSQHYAHNLLKFSRWCVTSGACVCTKCHHSSHRLNLQSVGKYL